MCLAQRKVEMCFERATQASFLRARVSRIAGRIAANIAKLPVLLEPSPYHDPQPLLLFNSIIPIASGEHLVCLPR